MSGRGSAALAKYFTAIRRAHRDGETYKAYITAVSATDITTTSDKRIELQKLIIELLEEIVSDLDEHGVENLHLYKNKPAKHFRSALAEAKLVLLDLEQPDRPRGTFAPLPAAPKSIAFGAPKKIAGPGPTPIVLPGDAFVGREGKTLALRDPRSGKVLRKLDADGEPKSLALSPDGKTLAVGLWGDRLDVLDVATGKPIWSSEKLSGWCWSLAWSADGKKLVSGSEGKLVVHDAKTGKPLASKKRGDMFVHSIAFANDEEILTVQDDHLWTWSIALEQRSKKATDVGACGMVAAGGRAVLLPYNGIALVDPATGEDLERLDLTENDDLHYLVGGRLALSPDRTLVAFLFVQRASAKKQTTDLVVCGFSPLRRVATVPLGASFKEPEDHGTGGIGFLSDGSLIVCGKTETLIVPRKR